MKVPWRFAEMKKYGPTFRGAGQYFQIWSTPLVIRGSKYDLLGALGSLLLLASFLWHRHYLHLLPLLLMSSLLLPLLLMLLLSLLLQLLKYEWSRVSVTQKRIFGCCCNNSRVFFKYLDYFVKTHLVECRMYFSVNIRFMLIEMHHLTENRLNSCLAL